MLEACCLRRFGTLGVLLGSQRSRKNCSADLTARYRSSGSVIDDIIQYTHAYVNDPAAGIILEQGLAAGILQRIQCIYSTQCQTTLSNTILEQ